MPNETPVDSLSVRLSEIEAWARKGHDLSPQDTLALVSVIRIYMAGFEESRKKVDAMIEKLGGGK